jgi:soluble cytochrome b562
MEAQMENRRIIELKGRSRHCALALTTLFLLLQPLVAVSPAEEAPAIVAQMRSINKGLRVLRRQLAQPNKKQQNLELLTKIKEDVLAAKKEQPLKTPELPESERGAFLEAFRARLDEVIAVIDQLKLSVREGKNEETQRLVGRLNELKKEGHKRFKSE